MSLVFVAALAGSLSACVMSEEAPVPATQCYWLSNEGAGWVSRPDLPDPELCFEMDSCSGGAGLSGGGCYKWATDADAPAAPWVDLGFAPLALAEDIPPPRDLYSGSYEITSDCPEQGCAYGPARLAANTPLYARQDTRARLVATIPVTECVMKTGNDALLSAPRRGVVLETAGRFTAGDVIYLTNYEGEGYSTVWRRGEYLSEFQDEVIVRWDEAPSDSREGYWVEVTRTNGQTGWVQNPEITDRECSFVRH
jgi:hypothetical protein